MMLFLSIFFVHIVWLFFFSVHFVENITWLLAIIKFPKQFKIVQKKKTLALILVVWFVCVKFAIILNFFFRRSYLLHISNESKHNKRSKNKIISKNNNETVNYIFISNTRSSPFFANVFNGARVHSSRLSDIAFGKSNWNWEKGNEENKRRPIAVSLWFILTAKNYGNQNMSFDQIDVLCYTIFRINHFILLIYILPKTAMKSEEREVNEADGKR